MQPVLGTTTSQQVAFVGPFGVGKSTAVRAISDTPVVNTDVRSAVGAIDGGIVADLEHGELSPEQRAMVARDGCSWDEEQ